MNFIYIINFITSNDSTNTKYIVYEQLQEEYDQVITSNNPTNTKDIADVEDDQDKQTSRRGGPSLGLLS
ncbi:11516_t:CDS:2 [Gigaspora margarita]|uniref:11516_t:CDS:1 n=1 Tax=Gigaspora margarita TaxID=4874 RepID=A0ABN7W5K7_GIGMA|nr:11516_t:CDS:2 [Gigaspora margarita]